MIDCRLPEPAPTAPPDNSVRLAELAARQVELAAMQDEFATRFREAEGELLRTRAELVESREQLRAARDEASARHAEAVAAQAETMAARAETSAARSEVRSARADADAARAEAESARTEAQAAHAEADASRDEARAARAQREQSAAQTRESAARFTEQVVQIETNRQRLAMLEEQVRLEQLAADDTESRVARARRALTDTEGLLSEMRDALAIAERELEETAQARAALAGQCESLRGEETALRASLVELEAQMGRLNGERVAALPRHESSSASGLLLPPDLKSPADVARPADWLGGLRGLDLGSEIGREFIERLGPLLDRHPDRRCLDEWARQARTVFLLCNTPDEAGRLKQLLDVWGEIDPDGIAAIAPAFHRTTTLFAAPSRVVRARKTVKSSARATRRRHAARRRGR